MTKDFYPSNNILRKENSLKCTYALIDMQAVYPNKTLQHNFLCNKSLISTYLNFGNRKVNRIWKIMYIPMWGIVIRCKILICNILIPVDWTEAWAWEGISWGWIWTRRPGNHWPGWDLDHCISDQFSSYLSQYSGTE